MLRIELYIRPSSFHLFHEALLGAGVKGVSIWQTKGVGHEYHETAQREIYRGAELKESYIDRVRIDTVIEDGQKDSVLKALTTLASENDVGTLRIFVTPILEAIRVPNK